VEMLDKGINSISASQCKSKFVTVVAWIFIVLTGFALFISIVQNIMITITDL